MKLTSFKLNIQFLNNAWGLGQGECFPYDHWWLTMVGIEPASMYVNVALYHDMEGNHYFSLCKKAIIHQVTTMLTTYKDVLFPGHNHLLTTGIDDPSL